MWCGKKGQESTKKIVMEQVYETTAKQNQDINGKKRNRKHKHNGSLGSRSFYSL